MQKILFLVAILILTITFTAASDDCAVKFKQDVFTHSKEMRRPLRIKLILQQNSYPCMLNVRLSNNQTATFRIKKDRIEVINIPEDFSNGKISVNRKSTEKLWLDIFSLEQESRSGLYEISGQTIFGIQTPSNRNIVPSKVANITCENKLYKSKTRQEIRGSVNLTRQFSLCQQYNKFVENDHYLRFGIDNVTVREHSLDFIATDDDRGYQVVEVSCQVKGGDGVKLYKIKFNLNAERCPSVSSSVRTSQIIYVLITSFMGLSK